MSSSELSADLKKTVNTVKVTVTDLSRGGAGLAKIDTGDEQDRGRAVFIPLTLPGDEVLARVTRTEKRYSEAELIEIISPSLNRQTPLCPVFGKCGGCSWQHVPYPMQWKTKLNGLMHALARFQVPAPNQWDEYPASQPWHYRNRVQLRGENGKLGFFMRGSRDLVPTDQCLIARPEINKAWPEIKKESQNYPEPFKVELEVLPNQSVRRVWNQRHGARGFRQVNDEQNEKMQRWISSIFEAPASSSRNLKPILYDLYGGSGNLSLPLVDQMQLIFCVDLSSPVGRPNGIPEHIQYFRSDVGPWLQFHLRDCQRFSMPHEASKYAIIDPPREGLGVQFNWIAKNLEKLGIAKIVAVGCDPDSWARDVFRWIKRGWKLERAAAFDFFPQTPHVEAVGFLTLSPKEFHF